MENKAGCALARARLSFSDSGPAAAALVHHSAQHHVSHCRQGACFHLLTLRHVRANYSIAALFVLSPLPSVQGLLGRRQGRMLRHMAAITSSAIRKFKRTDSKTFLVPPALVFDRKGRVTLACAGLAPPTASSVSEPISHMATLDFKQDTYNGVLVESSDLPDDGDLFLERLAASLQVPLQHRQTKRPPLGEK